MGYSTVAWIGPWKLYSVKIFIRSKTFKTPTKRGKEHR